MKEILNSLEFSMRGLLAVSLMIVIVMQSLTGDSLAATIRGTVTSSKDESELISANITINGTSFGASTDLAGKYIISQVSVGVYSITASMVGYETKAIENVVVYEDSETVLNFSLAPTVVKLAEVEITDATKKGSESRALDERMKSISITDALAGETMKSMPDPDVAQVVRRVTGVATVGGDAVIRGLGLRYSKVTLNNSQIAGTEPNTSGVSLELFPSSMMSSVNVSKSYMSDQSGEFGGGVINMNTWDIPAKENFSAGVSFAYSPDCTFRKGLTYNGGKYDFLGFDDGSRSLPEPIANATTKITRRGRFSETGYTPQELEELAESFDNNWGVKTFSAAPNQSYNFTYSNTTKFAGRDLGYIVSGLYKHSNSYEESHHNFFKNGLNDNIELQHSYDFQVHTESVTLGSMLAFRYDFSDLHRVNFNMFFNRDMHDETRYFYGWNDDRKKQIKDYRVRFLAETVISNQLSGRHLFTNLKNSSLEWQFTYSKGKRDEPDTREIQYEKDDGDWDYVLADENQSGSRIFNDMNDDSYAYGLDWSTKLHEEFKVKLGYSGLSRMRTSNSRMFQFEHKGNDIDKTEAPDSIFRAENIDPQGFEIREATRPTDAYSANHELNAVYLVADWQATEKWRFILGVRNEYSIQHLETFELFTSTSVPTQAEVKAADWLPALNAIYNLKKNTNLRFSLAQTVSRPDFRELSPYEYTNIIGGESEIGNPNLERAVIHHVDMRYEQKYGLANLLSVSLFYKFFEKPIESVIQPTAQHRISYENAESADNYGIELELRQKLGDILPQLSQWSVSTNLTLLKSNIQLSDSTKGIQTSARRPLHGQSPYLFNFSLTYTDYNIRTEANLYMHVFGKRISEVGAFQLPDVYELPHPDLDLVINQPLNDYFKLKASWENILDSEIKFRQGDKFTQTYRAGSAFSVGLSYAR